MPTHPPLPPSYRCPLCRCSTPLLYPSPSGPVCLDCEDLLANTEAPSRFTFTHSPRVILFSDLPPLHDPNPPLTSTELTIRLRSDLHA